MPFWLQLALQLRAQVLHVAFALDTLFVEQARDLLVGFRLQEAEGQVFHLPLDLPDAQAVGQRREHLQRLARQRHRGGLPARRAVAQRLQARGQPQHHHAQVARERQQHLAHVLGLRGRVVQQTAPWRRRRAAWRCTCTSLVVSTASAA